MFAVSDEEDYSSEIKDLGLLESGEDVNVAILDEGGKKYAMEPEEFDSDALRQFVLAFKKGKGLFFILFSSSKEPFALLLPSVEILLLLWLQ